MSLFKAEQEKRFRLIYESGTFKNIFGKPLRDYRDFVGGFDIIKFDQHFKREYGDYEDGDTSLSDAVRARYDDVAVELINYLLMVDYKEKK